MRGATAPKAGGSVAAFRVTRTAKWRRDANGATTSGARAAASEMIFTRHRRARKRARFCFRSKFNNRAEQRYLRRNVGTVLRVLSQYFFDNGGFDFIGETTTVSFVF